MPTYTAIDLGICRLPSWFPAETEHGEEKPMQPDGYIELPTGDGFIALPVFSLQRCTWLLPDMADGIPDAFECGAPISGRKCRAGHRQVASVVAANFQELGELS
jgi:hypothetical protein